MSSTQVRRSANSLLSALSATEGEPSTYSASASSRSNSYSGGSDWESSVNSTLSPVGSHDSSSSTRDDFLGSEIRKALIPSECLTYTRDESEDSRGDFKFLPADALERLICPDNIRRELGPSSASPEVIAGILQRRKKLFAIFTLMGRPQMILRVIGEDEGIDDDCFPFWHTHEYGLFYYPDSGQLSGGKPKKRVVRSLGPDGAEWTTFHALTFLQWQVCVPRFNLDCPLDGYHASRIEPHRVFLPKVNLPFINERTFIDSLKPDHLDVKNDPFSQLPPSASRHQVKKAYIHHAHRNPCEHQGQKRPCNAAPFAVKIIDGKETALHEIKTLARFEKPGTQYGHRLIRLLSSFEHAQRFYLIFPYADANLQQFWENKYPNVTDLPRGHGLAKWMSAELLGLVRGLYLIHHPPPAPDDGTEEVLGRHADIKPENILWFRKEPNPELEAVLVNEAEATRTDLPTGLLKICDFGIAEFHSDATVSMVNSHSVGGTHAYCAPEWRSPKPGETISQAYDSWSLGCVMLHYLTWYVEGYPGIKRFLAALKSPISEVENYKISMGTFFVRVQGEARINPAVEEATI
ncbi:kinase-like domain-containing protein [Podospora conica]|nr:kinase-like domain-containing protein [Schizothecium conicum]